MNWFWKGLLIGLGVWTFAIVMDHFAPTDTTYHCGKTIDSLGDVRTLYINQSGSYECTIWDEPMRCCFKIPEIKNET